MSSAVMAASAAGAARASPRLWRLLRRPMTARPATATRAMIAMATATTVTSADAVHRVVHDHRRISLSSHAQHDAKADDAMADRQVGGDDGRSAQRDAGGGRICARDSGRIGDHDRRPCRWQACKVRRRGCRAQRDGRRGVRSARERVHVAGGVIAVMSGAGHGMGAQHHAGRREGRTRCRRSRRRGRCRSRTDRRDARSRRSQPGRARPVTITDAGGAVAKRRARHVAVAVPEDGSAPNPQGVAGGNRRAAGDRRSRSPVSSSAARPRAGRAASARTASPPQRRRSQTKRAAPPAMR